MNWQIKEDTFAHRALLFFSLLFGYNLPALQNDNMKQKKVAENNLLSYFLLQVAAI
jgi:hypothetical protein